MEKRNTRVIYLAYSIFKIDAYIIRGGTDDGRVYHGIFTATLSQSLSLSLPFFGKL